MEAIESDQIEVIEGRGEVSGRGAQHIFEI